MPSGRPDFGFDTNGPTVPAGGPHASPGRAKSPNLSSSWLSTRYADLQAGAIAPLCQLAALVAIPPV